MAEPPAPLGVVAFSKDYDDDPTSNHHVLRELARSRRVLWLNSLATRTPSLSSGRDLGRIWRKLREFARGPVNVQDDLWVFTPLVLPLPHSRIARRLNALIVRLTVRALRARLRMGAFQLWTFLPNTADYIGIGESLSVYYCVDEWSLFSSVDAAGTVAAERALLARVDVVLAVNDALADVKRPLTARTFTTPHGVDQARFARALEPGAAAPADVAALPHPVLGFYGTLEDWVDLELLADVARLRLDWSIVLIGPRLVDTSVLTGLANVHLLGRRPYEQLPDYCAAFDVGLIPYRRSDQLPFRNPIKLREYLSAGLPVVATTVDEVRRYDRWCTVAEGAEQFVHAVEAALAEDSPRLRQERSDAMKDETWQARVQDVAGIVDKLAAEAQA